MSQHVTESVADEVRSVAAKLRKTQGDVADILEISKMSVSRRYNGHTPFTANELLLLSRAFGVPITTFYSEVEQGA